MERVRIGKDIVFQWEVRKDGAALSAEDAANLTLEIAGRNGKSQRLPFEIRDSKIIAAWYGVKQTEVGAYRLTCWYNRGKVSESVVDVVWAVELVQYTTEESFDDLETVTIELEGGNLTFGVLKGASSAKELSYDNSESELEADNVQDAIDETVNLIPNDITRDAENAQFVHVKPNGQPIGLFYLHKVDSQLAGLMTAADKQKMDALPTGAFIPVVGRMTQNGFDFTNSAGTILFSIPFADSTGGGLISFADLSRFMELGTKQELDAQFATKADKSVVDAIQALIPSQASASNQLADKDFVNSSIATSTATFRGSFNLVADLSLSVGATHAQIAAALGTHIATADNNDYAFVFIPTSDDTPTEIAAVERYKFDGTSWAFEYALNNSGFTAAQWAAINSGITALLVAKLQALPTASEIEEALRNKADKDEVEEKIAALEAVIADLETIAEGYVRVAGSSNPSLNYKSYKYHEQGGFGRESVFSLFYPCLVGTALTGADAVGKILHVLNKLDYTHDIYGNVRKIDGSEGDVLITNIEPYYMIRGQHTISGTDYDVFLVSREPFTWQGIEAEHVARFGWSPDYCVSHVDTDNVRRMHSVYNPDWAGSYTAPDGVVGKYVYAVDPDTGEITETFDPDATLLGGAGGLQTTDKVLYTGEQEAMNNNNDTTKPVPWFNHTAEGCNIMQSLLLAEGGTFDAHKAALMGSGFSANDPATSAADWEAAGSNAKNGFRVIDANGEWKMFSLGSNIQSWWGKTAGFYPGQIVNSWRNPWRIMEAHRAVSHAVQNGVHELEWFVFEGNLYKYRSIDGFAGTAQGEMTCVVWKKLSAQLGSAVVDPTDKTTSIAGNRAEILVSTALFHGMTTQASPSWWTSGLVWTQDENGNYTSWLERDQAELLVTPTGSKDVSDNFSFEEVYEQVGDTLTKESGCYKNYHNEALMLPATNADKVGGGLHTYVGIYGYYSGTNAAAGQKLVRGFRRGNGAYYTSLSPLFVLATYAPSSAASGIAFGTCCRIVENENRGA